MTPEENTRLLGLAISQCFGWIYTIAWSVSFWPQYLLNRRRHSVIGLSLDFTALNVLGFLCYLIYNILFLTSSTVQDEYGMRHSSSAPAVQWNDVVFALHAFILSALTLSQAYQPNTYVRGSNQRISRATYAILSGSAIAVAAIAFLTPTDVVELLDLVYGLSYIKMFITLIKYIPQMVLNHTRRSTVGWSLHNILLDFTGGVFSTCQLFLDAYLADDLHGVIGNPVKLALGLLSMSFDVVFMVQHYVLYPQQS